MKRRHFLLAAALTGCHAAPQTTAITRPDWRFTIDGLAPLMSPDQVRVALDRRGYRQIACGSDERLLTDPLNSGNRMPCYQSVNRPMRVSLYFLDLTEGRRLAVADFRELETTRTTHADQLASSRRLARRLRDRLGRPLTSSAGNGLATYYWGRPGGNPALPDLVSTTVSGGMGANVSLTSFWAYGQQRVEGQRNSTAVN